jgi:hypothetical protein
MTMADMYFDTGSQPHYYSNSQHIDFRFGNAPPIDQEFMMQQHIQTTPAPGLAVRYFDIDYPKVGCFPTATPG